MKRIISVILAVCILMSLTAISAQAAEVPCEVPYTVDVVPVYSYPAVSVTYNPEIVDMAIDAVRKAVASYDAEVDIYKYKISVDDINPFIFSLDYVCAELFARRDFNYGIYSKNGYISRIVIYYELSKEEHLAKQKRFNKEIARIVSGVNRKYSDLEKVLYIHDYLVSNYAYDTRLFTDYGSENHDSYNFLFEGVGVCQSYASTFQILMEQFGIESRVAVSPTHAWNIVELDGKFYHIDATHDDPLNSQHGEFKGTAHHNHFLLSDDGIRTDDAHSSWVTYPMQYADTVCNDTKYESYYWKNINSPLVEYNNKWYGMHFDNENDVSYVVKYEDISVDNHEHIHSFSDHWSVADMPGYYWPGCYSGLTSIGNTLYFNNKTSLCALDLKTGAINILRTFSSIHDIYSIYYDGKGKMHFITSESPNDAPDAEELESFDIGMGDVDQDGAVTAIDLSKVQQYLLGHDTMTNYGLADIVYDHEINVLDLIRMKKFLSGSVSLF